MNPEDAVPAARRAAERAVAGGEYADRLEGFTVAPTDRISTEQLMEFATIEPDPELMRSTRRFGGPITWVKQLLLRAMQQHFNELTSQQTRFNLSVVVRLTELEDRIARLEQRDGEP